MNDRMRCTWATKTPLDQHYHDYEWGKPHHDDKELFELLILETMQAGLSWSTILAKRENYREALDGFDPLKIQIYDQLKIEELLANPGIIRHKLKIKAIIKNARSFLAVQEEWGTFDRYLWSFVDYQPIVNHYSTGEQIPVKTELSEKLAADMKKRNFSFIGPVTCYAYLQAAGLINDHEAGCQFK
ncbi:MULTISPECIES: DNA-3-methyladenine glycosylase I [Carnobacterium]|uniref:DNA-3-methyladenine glycosylase I n=1 Tax=Carnobacterium antarcticum TaxID=2126436 RepID=A0ABW4NPZ7_9LACT|nr:DNA-3-methyladenine glycosylase I [Carnobacterium sp. CP1]